MRGYIIKLYQKLHKIDLDSFESGVFNVWFSFDFMRIIEINSFEEFYVKSMNMDASLICESDMRCTRQKLYLCGNDEKNIFSKDHEKPILTLSMIQFEPITSVTEREASLNQFLAEQGVEFSLFDSLSHSDKILVLRETSYAKVMDILIELQCLCYEGKKLIRKVYTIGCLDIEKRNNLENNDVMHARVEIALDQMNSIKIDENQEIKCVLGKADIEKLEKGSSYGLIQEFISKGFISESGESSGINRIILMRKYCKRELTNLFAIQDNKGENPVIELSRLKALMRKVSKAKYSVSMKNLLYRLLIRAWQMENGSYVIIRNHEIWTMVETFVNIALQYSDDSYHNDSAIEGIKSLSLLMDNMSSDNFEDFEVPQGNSRFTGTMSKLLQAYNNLLQELSKLTKRLRETSRCKDKETLEYYTWAVIDTNEVIAGKQLFIDPRSHERLLIINLSHDAMFRIREVIAWSIHEVGHCLRTNWTRKDRNEGLRENAKNAFVLVLEQYLEDEESVSEHRLSMLKDYYATHTICSIDVCEFYGECNQSSCRQKHIDYQIDKLMIYYGKVVQDLFAGKLIGNCKLDITNLANMRQDIEEYLLMLRKAYQEAQADMYMVSVLEIDEPELYIDILKKYFEFSNMGIQDVSGEVLIRMNAVIMIIDSKKKSRVIDAYSSDDLHDVLNRCYTTTRDDFTKALCDSRYFFFSQKLAEFLERVHKSIESALEDEECLQLKEKIKNAYKALAANDKSDSFERALQFIHTCLNTEEASSDKEL